MIDHKVTVVIPTYNEEKTIKKLLDSLNDQTKTIDEIIISDNNSVDNTKNIVQKYVDKGFNIRLYERGGKCRGSGRNQGIYNSKNDLIALIDAGTYADKNWIKNLLINYNDKNTVIFGIVKILFKNLFEHSIASSIVNQSKENLTIEESVSSLLITKTIWRKIGKFPESKNGEYVVEDLIFINRLKDNCKVIYSNKAYVNWLIPNNIKQLFKRYIEYSEGGFRNGFIKKWHFGIIRNLSILSIILLLSFYNYFFIILIIILIYLRSFFYLRRKLSFKSFSIIKKIKSILSISVILILIDSASIFGMIKYFLSKPIK